MHDSKSLHLCRYFLMLGTGEEEDACLHYDPRDVILWKVGGVSKEMYFKEGTVNSLVLPFWKILNWI